MIILGIESSCDECAVALVEDGSKVLSNVVASQVEIHAPYSGVVPELASRKHIEWILDVIAGSFREAGVDVGEIDGIAVTSRPGLVGSLMVGVCFAKGVAVATGKPVVGVDHLKAHLYAVMLLEPINYPYIGVVISGGHSLICRVDSFDEVEQLGSTIDDACGEAFDKVARHYGFGFPGGPAVEAVARGGDPDAYNFPKPSMHKDPNPYNFSYSGLKTAVIHHPDRFWKQGSPKGTNHIAASFQRCAIDIILDKLSRVVEKTGIDRVVIGGGVASNSYLRESVSRTASYTSYLPPKEYCTDNAAMVAGIGYHYLVAGMESSLSLKVAPHSIGSRSVAHP